MLTRTARRSIIAVSIVVLLVAVYAALGFWAVPHFARSGATDFVRTHYQRQLKIGDIRFICFYVPNGQSVGSEKYGYKLRWLAAATEYLRHELARHPRLAVVRMIGRAPAHRLVDHVDDVALLDEVLRPSLAAIRRSHRLGAVVHEGGNSVEISIRWRS